VDGGGWQEKKDDMSYKEKAKCREVCHKLSMTDFSQFPTNLA
jgi:hypothetical protein